MNVVFIPSFTYGNISIFVGLARRQLSSVFNHRPAIAFNSF